MKVLISSIACNPYEGSEGYFGWSAVKCLAHDHDLWVVTRKRNQQDLEKAAVEGLVPKNVRFNYAVEIKPWHPNQMVARLQSWKEYLHFSKSIMALARDLHQTVKFDLIHHVTYATWRVGSPLWKLGIPFIFGPVGGYEQFPFRFFPMLSPSAAGFELFRIASNITSRVDPRVRKCIRHAAHVFVANAETERLIINLRGSGDGVSRLMPAFHSEATTKAFSRFAAGKNLDGPLRLFAAGMMEGRKGVALALRALARAKRNGVNFRYRVGAGGPEIPHLKRLATELGIEKDVLFAENLRGEEYQRELGNTHVYLLPSLRESAGLTMMEAMLAGCVPVVADGGGPGIMVTDDCGYKIPVTSLEAVVNQMAETITNIDRNRNLIREKGLLASHRVATGFSQEKYRKTMNEVYCSVTGIKKT